ncbi:MAG TPA: hypothetical protein PKW63_09525 [Vicinamibacterales bacterium]|jgi:Flp pilus assembly pilin Flp|nr:hypothetical protein [Acidobacteriota bacterium]HQX81985.1 hypothetical protein [Vicinamibacterales bacterium]
MRTFAVRFFKQDDGQDLVEYALLTAFVGLASIAAFDVIGSALRATYVAWDSGINALWEPPAPQG